MFQSPSLRGSGRFLSGSVFCVLHQSVSIPFIAGQWSLREPKKSHVPRRTMFQSPSLRGSGRFRESLSKKAVAATGFNPLHCGAVVASPVATLRGSDNYPVSIPFIAGQWSLQSRYGGLWFNCHGVSIPFIAGQWSLRGCRPCPIFF